MRLRENEIVLFQGDSITDGNRGRNLDPNHVMGHGYQFIVGARLHADNLDRHIQTFNRGVSGNRVADLYGRWLEDTINLRPTLLSILIGVNDAGFDWSSSSGSNPARFEKIYRLLLDEALESCPGLRLVLMEPFTGGWFEDETRGRFMRERVGALQPVVRALAGEYGAAFVPLQAMFDEYSRLVPAKELIWDGVHPTITGHELIARQWLGCVQARFGDAE